MSLVTRTRAIIEMTYSDLCTITVRVPIHNDAEVTIGYEPQTICEDTPCRISYDLQTTSSETGSHLTTDQTVTLFIAPEIKIPSGSRVDVRRDGTGEPLQFWASGIPAQYATHQEIALDRLEGRA